MRKNDQYTPKLRIQFKINSGTYFTIYVKRAERLFDENEKNLDFILESFKKRDMLISVRAFSES